MRPIIEFCTSNLHHGTDQIMKKLEQNPDYDVLEYGCLGHCGECYAAPYALVNGDFITASTADRLYELIIEAIEAYEKQFDFIDVFDFDDG